MLTPEEKASLEAMPQEQLVKLLALIKEARALFTVHGCMPTSAMDDLVKAVGDAQVRDIVNDLRIGIGEPGWLPPSKPRPVERGGSVEPRAEKLEEPFSRWSK
jgi:hypothetical protein